MVRDYRQSTGFPWTYAMSTAAITQRFDVVETDTKYAIDASGTIIYQDGYGAASADQWQKLFKQMTSGA
jgi:hypothetical protein